MPFVRQHLAARGPDLEILRDFLSQGASVHLRNREGHTPLFLAAHAGQRDHVKLLMEAGAHLHSDELADAHVHAAKEREGPAAREEEEGGGAQIDAAIWSLTLS